MPQDLSSPIWSRCILSISPGKTSLSPLCVTITLTWNRHELWLPRDRYIQVWDALTGSGFKAVSAAAVELLRIACGIPRYGQDIRERDLPQETEQQRALHFSKGCYIGQEIVERIRSRGKCSSQVQRI